MIVMHLDYLLIFYFMYTVHAKHHMLKVEQVLFVFLKTVQPPPIFGQYKFFLEMIFVDLTEYNATN